MAGPKPNRKTIRLGSFDPAMQIRGFSDKQWEQFIEDACRRMLDGSVKLYAQVKRIGGSGDGGRDIEARLVAGSVLVESRWDLFQAKHYNHPLQPSDLFPEVAKFFLNLASKTYPAPRHYYVCSPQNAGPDLHNFLGNPAEFKSELLKSWKDGTRGLRTLKAEFSPDVEKLVSTFNFSIFREFLSRDLLEEHARDEAAYCKLFHIEMERGDDPSAPATPSPDEETYVSELLKAYSEDSPSLLDVSSVGSSKYGDHFDACRSEFYCAEGLKRFSRDLFVEDEFGALLRMVHNGLKAVVADPDLIRGLDRLKAAQQRASALNVSDSKLANRIRGGDLPGTCHHLANEKKLKWVK